MTLIIFLFWVGLYVAFLGWCVAPVILRRKNAPLRWFRFSIGLILFLGNFFGLFLWPIWFPVYPFAPTSAKYVQMVTLFARTVPRYVNNVIEHQSATATVIDVEYPMEINGVAYAPVVRTYCTQRQTIGLDKGVRIVEHENYPAFYGGELIAEIGEHLLALSHGFRLCSAANNSGIEINSFPMHGPGPIYFVRKRLEYLSFYQFSALSWISDREYNVDDIVLWLPRIIAIDQVPANSVIPIEALQPMSGWDDYPAFIGELRLVRSHDNRCIEVIRVSKDFRSEEFRLDISRGELREPFPENCLDRISALLPNDPIILLSPSIDPGPQNLPSD